MDKEIIVWLILKQIIVIICFTLLSIICNHWWIILFSILMLNSDVTINDKEVNKRKK